MRISRHHPQDSASPRRFHLARAAWLAAFALLAVLAVAVVFLLAVTVKLQRSLVSQSVPQYTGRQLYASAVQQIDKGDYKTAETYLEQALSKEDDATYRSQLAVVKYRLKEYGQSVEQYQKLVDAQKDPGFAYNGMGNAYRDWAAATPGSQDEYRGKAEAAYHRAIAADATYVAAYSNLALLLDGEGRWAEARSVLDDGFKATQATQLQDIKKNLRGGGA